LTTPLTDALVLAGIVTRHQIEAAWGAHDRGGEQLLLHLVLLGSVDGDRLAEFAADEAAVPLVTDEVLAGVTRRSFELLPFDLAYEHGLVSLGYDDRSRLRVAAFDPTDARAIEEATFAMGVEVDVHAASAMQVARTFERVAGRTWKVSAEELAVLRRGLGVGRERLDDDLRDLLRSGTSERVRAERPTRDGDHVSLTVLGTGVVRVELVDDVDGEVIELTPTGKARVQALDDVDGEVIELTPTGKARVEVVDAAVGEIFDLGAPAGPPPSELADAQHVARWPAADGAGHPLRGPVEPPSAHPAFDDVDGKTLIESPPAGDASGSDGAPRDPYDVTNLMFDSWGSHGPKVAQALAGRGAVSSLGSAAAASAVASWASAVSGATSVVRTSRDALVGAHRADWSQAPPTESTRRDASAWGERPPDPMSTSHVRFPGATPAGDSAVRSLAESDRMHSIRLDSESAEYAAVQPRSGTRLPSVLEVLDPASDGRYLSREEIEAQQESSATRAAFDLAVSSVRVASDRDGVARQICESLNLVFPTVLLLAPRQGRLWVWDASMSTGDAAGVGASVDLDASDVLTGVLQDLRVYRGTLPADDPLRRLLPRALGRECLVAPVRVAGKAVAAMLLGAGPASGVATAGPGIIRLQNAVDDVLCEVIARKKAGRGGTAGG